jgi:hypothetical protein
MKPLASYEKFMRVNALLFLYCPLAFADLSTLTDTKLVGLLNFSRNM